MAAKKEAAMSSRSVTRIFLQLLTFLCLMPAVQVLAGPPAALEARDIDNILPERARAELVNRWLEWRLDNILPRIMRREGIDLWLVLNREYNEDPVYLTLVPEPIMSARRTSILIFHDRGGDKGVERLNGGFYGLDGLYQAAWPDKTRPQLVNLAEVIKKLKPRKIAIDRSKDWAFGDGLTAGLEAELEKALGPELLSRFVSGERLALGWLETRSPQEIGIYRHLAGIAHDLIAEFLSNRVIIPEVTTTDDVVWWIRQRITELGLQTWFQPSVDIQRAETERAKDQDPKVIRPGDLLHCDVGLRYLRLCTDMQWQAYVLRPGQVDAPEGLREALRRANRVADIFMAEFRTGRTGLDIVTSAMNKAEAAGLRPLIYSHPLGFHGHGAGCIMDARPKGEAPEGILDRMNYPLYPDTAFAIEFSSTTAVPEWGGRDVRIAYEETAVFTAEGCRFADGRQETLLLIKP
jgi:Xaa-Pro aminopeptidase